VTRELIHRGRKIQVLLDTTTIADGTVIRRDVILHPGAVVILPMVDRDHVCLLRNHRFVVDETLWELPAGTLEAGEPPERAAVRELAEETGYVARRWQKLAAAYASPGCLSEMMHIFVAEELTPGPARPEKDETLEPHIVEWSAALGWTADGTIRDVKTIAGLLLWDRHRSRESMEPGDE
jgi:ADP-ribose pyrophosphatase